MGLVSTVHVYDDADVPHIFGPDDELPEWAARKMGAHCFEGGIHPCEQSPEEPADDEPAGSDAEPVEPPRGGAGSGREAWEAFATAKNVAVDESMSREQIIEALAEAGVVE